MWDSEFTAKASTLQGGGVRRVGAEPLCSGLCPSFLPAHIALKVVRAVALIRLKTSASEVREQ
jgi:hypothetical protein